MLTICTYKVIPFLLPGSPHPTNNLNNGTYWLREAVNTIYNRNKARLKKLITLTDVFHNHFENMDKTIVRYPLVMYQRIGTDFFVTGINQGVEALSELLVDANHPIAINDQMLLKFELQEAKQMELNNTETLHAYFLSDWLALNNDKDKFRQFQEIDALSDKINFLEKVLQAHIVNDFGKHLQLELDATMARITNIDSINRSHLIMRVNKNVHTFQPFNISFNANIDFPDHICLGNGKVYGYGLLTRNPLQ